MMNRWERAIAETRALLHANEALMAERQHLRRVNVTVFTDFVGAAGMFCATLAPRD